MVQIEHTLLVIQTMVDMYANETVVMGLQPVNEPWQFTPIDWLKVITVNINIFVLLQPCCYRCVLCCVAERGKHRWEVWGLYCGECDVISAEFERP